MPAAAIDKVIAAFAIQRVIVNVFGPTDIVDDIVAFAAIDGVTIRLGRAARSVINRIVAIAAINGIGTAAGVDGVVPAPASI